MSYHVKVDLNFVIINVGNYYSTNPKFAIELGLSHWRYDDNLSNYVNVGDVVKVIKLYQPTYNANYKLAVVELVDRKLIKRQFIISDEVLSLEGDKYAGRDYMTNIISSNDNIPPFVMDKSVESHTKGLLAEFSKVTGVDENSSILYNIANMYFQSMSQR